MPTSYQAPSRGDKKQDARSYSQTVASNLSPDTATVAKLIAGKGDAIYSITAQDTIKTAVEALRDKHIGALVVVGSDGSLEGILSERDIVRKLADTPGQTLPQRVEEVMTSKVVTCTAGDTLVTVLKAMTKGRFRHMPVVEGGTLKGMITIGDVVNFRLSELEHEALQLKQMIVG